METIGRRKLLRSAAGVASITALGPATGFLGSGSPTSSEASPLAAVPAAADAVVYADVDTIRTDEGVQVLTDTYLRQRAQSPYYEGPDGYDELLAEIETEWETDPKKLHEVTAFGRFGGRDGLFADYGGAVLEADLSAGNVADALANLDDVDFEAVGRSGSVVYEPDGDGPWVGTLPSERVVVGTEGAVADAIGVANGDRAGVEPDLTTVFGRTRAAPVRFASRLPRPRNLPTSTAADSGEEIDLTPARDIVAVGGSVFRDGAVRALETTVYTQSSDAAADVAEMLGKLRDRAAAQLRAGPTADLVGDIAIERDGTTVRTGLKQTVGELRAVVEDAT